MKELKSRMTNLEDAEDVIEKVYYQFLVKKLTRQLLIEDLSLRNKLG